MPMKCALPQNEQICCARATGRTVAPEPKVPSKRLPIPVSADRTDPASLGFGREKVQVIRRQPNLQQRTRLRQRPGSDPSDQLMGATPKNQVEFGTRGLYRLQCGG